MPSQTDNGKAFEYSVAAEYDGHLSSLGLNVSLIRDAAFSIAQSKYNLFKPVEQRRFDTAAKATIPTLLKLEPGLTSPADEKDLLTIRIAPDSAGQLGDVRDIIFKRPFSLENWEIGISAKNNHEAVKHSRLSPTIDFGREWIGTKCSPQYFQDIRPIFSWISSQLTANPKATWSSLGTAKELNVYRPVLNAFRDETKRLLVRNPKLPELILRYLIGRSAFYKVIKDDSNSCVAVKGFNLKQGLNRAYGGKKPSHLVEKIVFPSRIIEFDFVAGLNTTLMMVLDQGWQIKFRIHNASSKLEMSLKFDINLIGNPPVLFTQHLFI